MISFVSGILQAAVIQSAKNMGRLETDRLFILFSENIRKNCWKSTMCLVWREAMGPGVIRKKI